ncbi:MAG: diguanylate cyclase [Thiogranum sp.]|nr:diguanylate cyclase [Thiogranum sp.]
MTYQKRLIFYVLLLVLLLTGMMMLSFQAARDVILATSDEQLRHAAQREQDNLRTLRAALAQEALRIAALPQLDELTVAAGAVGGDLTYREQFSDVSANPHILLSPNGELLSGPQIPEVIEAITGHPGQNSHDAFFVRSSQGLFMVAVAPVIRAGQVPATLAVLRRLNRDWLQHRAGVADDYLLFFALHQQVLLSNHPVSEHHGFDTGASILRTAGQQYSVREIVLEGARPGMPRLWLGVSEAQLYAELRRYERWVYLFTILGGAAVLMVGWLILRNFGRPFSQLMNTTQELLEGRLPVVARSSANTEMDQLVNRFADVLDSLRLEQKELRQVHEKLQHTAITDSLTKLYNRRYLQEVAPGLFAQVDRDERYLTSILLDLDHFKEINDQHGHLAGDAVLVHFSRLLKHNSRANDHLFRIGGEEFLILNVTEDPEDSVALAEKVRELAAASDAIYQGLAIPLTVSAGISCHYAGSGSGSLSQLLRGADKALYEAKANGRNCVVLHGSCRSAAAVAKTRSAIKLVKNDPA